MNRSEPPWLSIILSVSPRAKGLDYSLRALARLAPEGWECLLACGEAKSWAVAQEACAKQPGPWLALSPPPTGPGAALPQALAQARGDVALFAACGAAVPTHLPGLLRRCFSPDGPVALGLALQPPSGGGPLAGLAGLELLAQQEDLPLPAHGCAAFDRQAVLESGGLAPLPGLEVLDLWLRLQAEGHALAWEDEAYLVMDQPKTMGGLMARARGDGQAMFGRRRLMRRLGRGAGQGKKDLQALLALAAPCLLAGLWPQAPDRAATISLLAWLLLYPLNRPFLHQVAEYRPGVVGQAMLYCMIRPYAWLAGMAGAALARLGGGDLHG